MAHQAQHPHRSPHPLLRRRTVLLLGLVAGLGACGGGSPPGPDADDTPPPDTGNDAALASAADAALAAGLVGVVLGDATTGPNTLAIAGLRRQGTADPVTASDRFAIGSNTKAMTCAAMAAMVARGWIGWDTRIADALPELAPVLHPAYSNVTLLDLLNHLGAMPAFNGSGTEEDTFFAAVNGDPDPMPENLQARRRYFCRWVVQQEPVVGVTPGQDYHYSNAGYALAATMVEGLAGRPFEAMFQEVLLDPLGLSGHWRSPDPLPSDRLWGHRGDRGALTPVAPDEGPEAALINAWMEVLYPGGYWACTGATYAHWLHWHVKALRAEPTPLAANYVAQLRGANDNRYVLGWQSATLPERTVLMHTGHVPGFMAAALMDTRGDRAVFGLTNTGQMEDTGNSWVLAVLENAMAALLARPLPQGPSTARR